MPPNAVVESILEEIDLEIVDPFADGDATQYLQGTIPIPRTTPPPQHAGKCADEAYLRIRQNADF